MTILSASCLGQDVVLVIGEHPVVLSLLVYTIAMAGTSEPSHYREDTTITDQDGVSRITK